MSEIPLSLYIYTHINPGASANDCFYLTHTLWPHLRVRWSQSWAGGGLSVPPQSEYWWSTDNTGIEVALLDQHSSTDIDKEQRHLFICSCKVWTQSISQSPKHLLFYDFTFGQLTLGRFEKTTSKCFNVTSNWLWIIPLAQHQCMTPIMCEHGSMLPWQHISRVLLLPQQWLGMSLNRWGIIMCV